MNAQQIVKASQRRAELDKIVRELIATGLRPHQVLSSLTAKQVADLCVFHCLIAGPKEYGVMNLDMQIYRQPQHASWLGY